MDYRDIITIDPAKRGRQALHPRLRITVCEVLDYLVSGMPEDQILADFLCLTREDIPACVAVAADRERRLVSPPPAA